MTDHRRPDTARAPSTDASKPPMNPTASAQSAAEIAERLYRAILEHRIPPGTKLAEVRLAAIFSTTRARIRDALSQLAHERVVEIVLHHGASVAKPSVQEARDLFEARRLIEPFVIGKLITTLSDDKISALRRHLEAEEAARQHADRPRMIRLSNEFHVLLAALAGNTALTHAMRALSSQTCLTIGLYSSSTEQSCRADEHSAIVQAIVQGDAQRANALVLEHFDHIEATLNLQDLDDEVDLEGALGL